jgi:hypothetical protein
MATDNPVMEPADVFYGTAEAEDSQEQPEAEAVTESEDQEALAEDAEIDGQPETEDEVESEESEESEGDDEAEVTEDGEQELVYLDLDGKEVDLDEVRQWRDGHLMQADYTRKTTELAEERKALQTEREEVSATKSRLAELQVELQAIVAEDVSANIDELLDPESERYDPEEYARQVKKVEARKATVEKLKSEAVSQPMISDDEIVSEQQALFAANPSWLDKDNKPTAEFESDQKLMNEYFKTNGFTQEDVGGMFRARYIETCLKAAKFDQLQGKASKIKSKAKKATLVTKPKKQARRLKPKAKTAEELFYG